ncbi:NAD(P)H-binding protein [Nocardia sp. NPDC051990]|uniref:NAD(P)-dependent oxidoreductase n=1 Tax=Nocardia sp. NPDC051990 TaxID=3155285 RepID=UPI0034477D6F
MAAITVIGATGRTGRLVVEQALARRHRVTAITRQPWADPPNHPELSTATVDLTDSDKLTGLLNGQDAVISALGSAGRGPTTVYSAGTAALAAALPSRARLLVISSAGLQTPADAGPIIRAFGRLLYRIMHSTYDDMHRMERQLARSDLTWTAVRPTQLTDAPGTDRLRISLGATERVGNRTTRTDLARYLLDAIDDPHTHHTAVAISS